MQCLISCHTIPYMMSKYHCFHIEEASDTLHKQIEKASHLGHLGCIILCLNSHNMVPQLIQYDSARDGAFIHV